jgi:hypothetical protein
VSKIDPDISSLGVIARQYFPKNQGLKLLQCRRISFYDILKARH